jgi:hypothetical protein
VEHAAPVPQSAHLAGTAQRSASSTSLPLTIRVGLLVKRRDGRQSPHGSTKMQARPGGVNSDGLDGSRQKLVDGPPRNRRLAARPQRESFSPGTERDDPEKQKKEPLALDESSAACQNTIDLVMVSSP